MQRQNLMWMEDEVFRLSILPRAFLTLYSTPSVFDRVDGGSMAALLGTFEGRCTMAAAAILSRIDTPILANSL